MEAEVKWKTLLEIIQMKLFTYVQYQQKKKLWNVIDCMFLFYILCALIKRVRKIAKSDLQLRRVCPSAWNNSAPNGWIYMESDI
jgi:hypothetical protein